ncbi:hypothetical protein [Wolbachia endosymbiont (group E) of Neria commutata]|uniref:hypothetical protein n=1 Tax=Wolbachia endosymbiont (group E) of Neria commutata TaxID=3066149 RepID=UPI003132BE8A
MVKEVKEEIENNFDTMASFLEFGNTQYKQGSVERTAPQVLHFSTQNGKHKLSGSDISCPVAFDPSTIKREEVAIRFNASNQDVIQDDNQTLLTFSSGSSGRDSTSSGNGISSNSPQTRSKEVADSTNQPEQQQSPDQRRAGIYFRKNGRRITVIVLSKANDNCIMTI